LKEFFKQRLEESINEILIAKGIFEKISFTSLLIQNESGFTEQILLNFAQKNHIPIILISHGLSYETLNSQYADRRIFDGVDPIRSSKYLVWGQSQFMFAKNYGIDEKKLKIIGSPSHDMLFHINQKDLQNDYVLLATSSPTASIIKDLTIDTLEKYENTIKDICKIVTENGKNLIIKLHPFQEELDITNLVNSVNPNIKILKIGDITDLIKNCSIFLTIDISTTILDAQIFSKPVISISVKNYNWGIPTIFESNSCIRTNMDSFEKNFSDLQSNTDLQEKITNQSLKFIDDYLSFQGNSSPELLKFLQSVNNESDEEQVL
jgi:CDP-glycerol glycerophosphotransferase (TagB/SpsB family)